LPGSGYFLVGPKPFAQKMSAKYLCPRTFSVITFQQVLFLESKALFPKITPVFVYASD
jgi:hypothetical protein